MKKILSATLISMSVALLISGCVPTSATGALNSLGSAATRGVVGSSSTAGTSKGLPTGSSSVVTYDNKTYGFTFTIPAGWSKTTGKPDSDMVLFSKIPMTNACSFQFHITAMRKSFPAGASVNASYKAAKEDIAIKKIVSVKRRNDRIKNKKASVIGWEIVDNGKSGGYKRIIYQAYDAQNHYFNLTASASVEKFESCRPELRKIIDSIKFN